MQWVALDALADGAARLGTHEDGSVDPIVTVVALDDANWSLIDRVVSELSSHRTNLLLGVSTVPLPDCAARLLETLTFTIAPSGPGRTWISPADADAEPDALADEIGKTLATVPTASLALMDLLELTSHLGVRNGLVAESFAYSTLLVSHEFRAWRERTPRRVVPPDHDPVLLERLGGVLQVRLNRPERHNAFSNSMRDGLLEAFEMAERDETITQIAITGEGRSFCSGGDLDEFGTATDAASAHHARMAWSAGWAVHRLRDRVVPELHGACIGAGIEVPAFASHVVAHADATFALPELSFGLVPGAGGTVSVTRRIGRWRTAFLALSGQTIGIDRALRWGLVDGHA